MFYVYMATNSPNPQHHGHVSVCRRLYVGYSLHTPTPCGMGGGQVVCQHARVVYRQHMASTYVQQMKSSEQLVITWLLYINVLYGQQQVANRLYGHTGSEPCRYHVGSAYVVRGSHVCIAYEILTAASIWINIV